MLAGVKRLLAHKVTKKEPIKLEHLLRLVEEFGAEDTTLADVRALTFCFLGYARFLRFDELSILRVCDVSIYKEHKELFIESSKTDQLRQGATVVIACTGSRLCPVAMLERYLRAASVGLGASEQFLFRGIIHSKNGMRLREKGGLSYTTVRRQCWTNSKLLG